MGFSEQVTLNLLQRSVCIFRTISLSRSLSRIYDYKDELPHGVQSHWCEGCKQVPLRI